MLQQTAITALEVGGSAEEQALATEIWNLMRMRGMSYSNTRPISVKQDLLVEYFVGRKYKGLEDAAQLAELIDKAVTSSPAVFDREVEQEEVPGDTEAPTTRDVVIYKTTKEGKAPGAAKPFDTHSFANRLRLDVQAVVPEVEEDVAQLAQPHHLPALNLPVAASPNATPAVPAATKPGIVAQPTPAPAVRPAASAPTTATAATTTPTANPVARPATPVTSVPTPAQATPQPAPAPAVRPAPTTPAATPAATPVEATSAPVEITLADGVTADLSRPSAELLKEHGDYFASALLPALQEDFRFVSFLNDWYLDENTGRYSKGDFRRIRDYMTESESPVSDLNILSDLWGKRATDADYEATRFALNYRLSKEKREFEFVGTADERIWTSPGVPQLGNPRHKPNDIGTDYRFLEDSNLHDASELEVENGKRVWRHTLTFYEHENGVLPYDATTRELFPKPLFEDQKSIVLRFEAPQLNGEEYSVELRLPSGNRGGWLGGLESFFEQNLVPGAILVVREGDRDNHFFIEYQQGEEQEVNVLLYDDRRQKFVFRPIVLACKLNGEGLLTPDRYSKLNGRTRLEESDRRKTDQLVMSAFEITGQKTSQGYSAQLNDLYPIVNIERPFSHNYLQHLLTHGNSQFQQDEANPNLYWYKPPTTGIRR